MCFENWQNSGNTVVIQTPSGESMLEISVYMSETLLTDVSLAPHSHRTQRMLRKTAPYILHHLFSNPLLSNLKKPHECTSSGGKY